MERIETTADTKACKVGDEIRDYVRDRFTPGSLSSLDELRDKVAAVVWSVILMDRVERSETPDPNAMMHDLQRKLDMMRDYLQMRVDMEDWHGVQDAASDIREIVAKIGLIKELI